jgi:hypothetical protein
VFGELPDFELSPLFDLSEVCVEDLVPLFVVVLFFLSSVVVVIDS